MSTDPEFGSGGTADEVAGKGELLYLPDEVIEAVAERLDPDSLSAFALVHRHIERICLKLRRRIRSTVITNEMLEFMFLSPLRVRELDLTDCWSPSERMKAFITKCENLETLTVINSALSLPHLFEALEVLTDIKELNFTVGGSGDGIELRNYPNIKKMQVEIVSARAALAFTWRFLHACQELEWLQICAVGNAANSAQVIGRFLDTRVSESAERWKRSRAVVFSSHMLIEIDYTTGYFLDSAVDNAFRGRPRLFLPRPSRFLPYNVFVNDLVPPERKALDAVETGKPYETHHRVLISMRKLEFPIYHINRPRGLRITANLPRSFKMSSMQRLSGIVELDFTECHVQYSAESWSTLISPLTAVNALALPFCALLSRQGPGSSTTFNYDILRTLQRLDLKKLHVKAKNRLFHGLGCVSCESDSVEFDAGCLNGFEQLKEFTLIDTNADEIFFKSVRNALSLETLKLSLAGVKNLNGLKKFFSRCKNLKFLKLEAPDLPLHSPQLWEALFKADLKQLCVSSELTRAIDLTMLKPKLLRLLKTLDVFHLHGTRLSNSTEVDSVLREVIREANDAKRVPVQHVPVLTPPLSNIHSVHDICLPGRALCSVANLIARARPLGWECQVPNSGDIGDLSGRDY